MSLVGVLGLAATTHKNIFKMRRLLEKAFYSPEDEDLKDRYAFYTAQSYRDADMYEKAIEWYAIRANLGGWSEEVYHSLLQISFIKNRIKCSTQMRYNVYC